MSPPSWGRRWLMFLLLRILNASMRIALYYSSRNNNSENTPDHIVTDSRTLPSTLDHPLTPQPHRALQTRPRRTPRTFPKSESPLAFSNPPLSLGEGR